MLAWTCTGWIWLNFFLFVIFIFGEEYWFGSQGLSELHLIFLLILAVSVLVSWISAMLAAVISVFSSVIPWDVR